MSEFDGIEGFDGWNEKLSELLGAAEQAAQEDDLAPRLAVSRRLTDFVVNSTPNTPEILALDQIANATRSALLRATIEERLQSLAEREGELASLTKKMALVTTAANESAASIRLQRANNLVKSLTESVQSLKEFQGVLSADSTDAELVASVEKVVASIQKLRTQVENKG